jgi:hypothetical protein
MLGTRSFGKDTVTVLGIDFFVGSDAYNNFRSIITPDLAQASFFFIFNLETIARHGLDVDTGHGTMDISSGNVKDVPIVGAKVMRF